MNETATLESDRTATAAAIPGTLEPAPAVSQPVARQRDLRPWVWLGAPLASLAIIWLAPLVMDAETWEQVINEEIGFLEIGTVAMLFPAVVLSVLVWRRRRLLPRGVGWLVLMGGLAALYFGGEEISWGQTYFQWETPEGLAHLNRQQETNLHNLELAEYGPWVDLLDDVVNNIPRQIMLGLCLVGGVILPLSLRKRLKQRPNSFWRWALPTWRLVPVALLASCSTVPEKLYKIFVHRNPNVADWPRDSYAYLAFIEPSGEFKEYVFAMVILLYMLSLYLRTGSLRAEQAGRIAEAN